MKRLLLHIATLLSLCLLIQACSVDKYIPEGEYMLDKVKVTCDNDELMKAYALSDYVTQNTNTKWFGARVPLRLYTLSGTDTTKSFTRFLRKIGQAPVLYDSLVSAKQMANMTQALANAGYLKAEAHEHKTVRGKKMKVTYDIAPGWQYTIRSVTRIVADKGLENFICKTDTAKSLLKAGNPFDINLMNEERKRLANALRNRGYYKFTKENITFRADTAQNSIDVDVTLRVSLHQENGRTEASNHRQYTIGNVTFLTDAVNPNSPSDTISHNGFRFISQGKPRFRPQLLTSHSLLKRGELYNADKFKQTYNFYNRLSAVAVSNIHIDERNSDTIDCNIILNHAKPHSFGLDVEATNSAGDLGAALSTSYQNKNLLRGSESFTFKVRGAYEAITGLDGYDGHSYVEFGAEARLNFPSFLLPFVKRDWATVHNSSSEIALQYNMQNRPEFNRRVLTAAWRYKWSSRNQHIQHRFDLLEVNYVYMPWISRTFKDQYLDSLGKTNAILKYNYENLLITKTGYTYAYNSLGARQQTFGKTAYTFRFNIETSGSLLDIIASAANTKRNDDNQRTFCGIAYAQYVRGDLDFSQSIRIDKNNSVAFHAALGIAYPYGNSNQLPFEKRYFAGGANCLRGWSVRSLGPGSYNSSDRGINFLNQSGDIKLDLSLEYRAQLFWKFSGAAFVDAGNIWTIRKYKDQPGGDFQFEKFFKELAVSYGIGLRMDANFFIVRFDAGMKAINPALSGRDHYPIFHPNFDRDFAFHFAVGLPF